MRRSVRGIVKRKVIRIDEDKCDGCGQCVPACAEGAIRIIDGKARLISDRFCDGLGECLGHCPQGAISMEERESEPFDEEAVAARRSRPPDHSAPGHVCPSAQPVDLSGATGVPETCHTMSPSDLGYLRHWPVQLHLLPPTAPFLRGADLLVCATCVPVAMADFHTRLLAGRAVVIACPKLDDQTGYLEKLAAMFAESGLKSVTVARMSVPCCGGLLRLVHEARDQAGSTLPIADVVIGHNECICEMNTDSSLPGRVRFADHPGAYNVIMSEDKL